MKKALLHALPLEELASSNCPVHVLVHLFRRFEKALGHNRYSTRIRLDEQNGVLFFALHEL